MNISFPRTFYMLACVAAFFILLFFGKPLLVPLASALMVSFILYPVCLKLESWSVSKIGSAIIALGILVAVVGLTLYFFSSQIFGLLAEFTDFEKKITMLFNKALAFINAKAQYVPSVSSKEIINNTHDWMEKSSGDLVSGTVNHTALFLSNAFVIIVYTFLLLIYRGGIKNVILSSVKSGSRDKVKEMLILMQQVGQQYLLGMSIIIVILGTANTLVLFAFGIDHAFLFGFLASLLAIIPYVGTTIGALLPVFYALMTRDSFWIPLGVAGSFWFIQLIENNFLGPKIVGGSLKINALAAILALILGGFLWGVAGMILFLPLTAIIKVFCSYFDQLKPVSLLLSDDLYDRQIKNKLSPMKAEVHETLKELEK